MIHAIQGFFAGIAATSSVVWLTWLLAAAKDRAEQVETATVTHDSTLFVVIDVLDQHFPRETSGTRLHVASQITHAITGGRRG